MSTELQAATDDTGPAVAGLPRPPSCSRRPHLHGSRPRPLAPQPSRGSSGSRQRRALPPQPTPDAEWQPPSTALLATAAAFDRIARTVRRSILLARTLSQPAKPAQTPPTTAPPPAPASSAMSRMPSTAPPTPTATPPSPSTPSCATAWTPRTWTTTSPPAPPPTSSPKSAATSAWPPHPAPALEAPHPRRPRGPPRPRRRRQPPRPLQRRSAWHVGQLPAAPTRSRHAAVRGHPPHAPRPRTPVHVATTRRGPCRWPRPLRRPASPRLAPAPRCIGPDQPGPGQQPQGDAPSARTRADHRRAWPRVARSGACAAARQRRPSPHRPALPTAAHMP